jgi:hypothetical protein
MTTDRFPEPDLDPAWGRDGEETGTAGEPSELDATRAVAESFRRDWQAWVAEAERLRAQKDGAYRERDMCVALMARLAATLGYRVGMARHEGEWEDDWRWIVYVDLPSAAPAEGPVSERAVAGWLSKVYGGRASTDERWLRVARVAIEMLCGGAAQHCAWSVGARWTWVTSALPAG